MPSVPLLVSLGLNYVSAADGLMPDEKYVAYMSSPGIEETPSLQVILWNDGTVQIMLKSSGWGYTTETGPFEDEGHFLLQFQP